MNKNTPGKCGKVRCAFLLLLVIVQVGANGVKELSINVPSMVRSGDTVTLSCNYDLQGGQLYRIQWYLDEKEFYRYTPTEPDQLTFDVGDICVNVSESNMYDVTLMNISRNMTGNYKCEVTDASAYYTVNQNAFMEVVDAPKTDPRIDIEKERITVAQTLQANCTSGSSRPASVITWKLNGQPITNATEFSKIHSIIRKQLDGAEITVSSIKLTVTTDMFNYGRMYLRCTASISDVYRKSAEVEIIDESPRLASITRDASPHSDESSGCEQIRRMWSSLPGAVILLTSLKTFESLLLMVSGRVTLR